MGIPEKPSLIERFVQLIPLPYPLAALTWTIVLDPFGFRLAKYLQSGGTSFPLLSPNPYNEFFGILLAFYLYYVVRYLRLRVLAAEPLISPVMSGGEGAYHSVFGRLTSNRPIILLTIILEALALPTTGTMLGFSALSGYSLITQFVVLLAFACFVWEYSVSNWGLHKLGQSQLKLRPFLEDRFMGARSIGNVALSSTVAYLGGLLLFFLDSATFLPVTTNLGFAGFFLVLLALGIVMFFLPLNSVHKKMQAEKAERQRELSRQFITIKQATQVQSSNGPGSVENVEKAITDLLRLKDLEITDRKLASTPTWPFDVQLLAKLITIVVSVTAVLLSRIITSFLHI
jgi:hypothetical protein